MRLTRIFGLALVVAVVWVMLPAATSAADVYELVPADPQPEPGAVKSGLSVKYAYPGDVKGLSEADGWRNYNPKKGAPLVGFDYPTTQAGEKVLTSDSSEYVVGFIDGYISFDEPGVHYLEFWSNDGLRVEIGGVQVYEHDGPHPCETLGPVSVRVPQAGWYPVKALFFQRRNTACLIMNLQTPDGKTVRAPHDMYGYVPQ